MCIYKKNELTLKDIVNLSVFYENFVIFGKVWSIRTFKDNIAI